MAPAETVELTWSLTRYGSATCTWTTDSATLEIHTSYLGDALRSLLRAAVDLQLGSSATIAYFLGEPGGHRVFFSGASEEVYVQIVSFADLQSAGRRWDGARLRWDGRVRTDLCIDAVCAMGEKVLAHYPEAEYEKRWGLPFPAEELALLQAGRTSGGKS